MISRVHQSFLKNFVALPRSIQRRAKKSYRRFMADPTHPALQFKLLNAKYALWSVRVSDSYRAVGVRKSSDEIIWFFIGTHAEYDKLLAAL